MIVLVDVLLLAAVVHLDCLPLTVLLMTVVSLWHTSLSWSA